jgi:hypothetical protein
MVAFCCNKYNPANQGIQKEKEKKENIVYLKKKRRKEKGKRKGGKEKGSNIVYWRTTIAADLGLSAGRSAPELWRKTFDQLFL